MFGLDNQETKWEVEMIMKEHNAVLNLMHDTQYQRIGIEKKPLTEQDLEKIGNAASELYKLLSTTTPKIRRDYLAMMSFDEKDFDYNAFTNFLMACTFITLMDEGKIQPKDV